MAKVYLKKANSLSQEVIEAADTYASLPKIPLQLNFIKAFLDAV